MNEKIVITGYSAQEFHKVRELEQEVRRCYVCKRTHGDVGIAVVDGRTVAGLPVEVQLIEVGGHENGKQLFFPLCHDCVGLLATAVNKFTQPADPEPNFGSLN